MKLFVRVMKSFNLIDDIAESFSVKNINDAVAFPPTIASGVLKGYSFPNNLNLYIGRYKLNFPWELETINNTDNGAFCIFTGTLSQNLFIKTDGEWVKIGKGNPNGLFFYSPGTSVEVRYPANELFNSVAVTFTVETVKAIIDDVSILEGIAPNKPFIYYDEISPAAEKLITTLSCACDDSPMPKFEIYKTLLAFLHLILERVFVTKDRYNLSGLPKGDVSKVFLIKALLTEDVRITPSIADLSRRVGMSESKMNKLFKRVFDQTIYQFAQKAKVEHAKQLLTTGYYNISEAGDLVGYTNLSHFSKAFRKYFGINPSEFLKTSLMNNE